MNNNVKGHDKDTLYALMHKAQGGGIIKQIRSDLNHLLLTAEKTNLLPQKPAQSKPKMPLIRNNELIPF